LAPDGAGGDGDSGEDHTRLRRGEGEPVPAGTARQEVADAAEENEAEGEIGREYRRHVEIHDALDVALHGLARSIAEGRGHTGDEGEDGQPAEGADGHQPSGTNTKVSPPPTRWRRPAAASSLSQAAASARGCPRITDCVALTAPRSMGT